MTKVTEALVNHSNSIKNFNKHVYHFRLSFGWNYVTSSCVYLFIYLTGRFRNSNQVLERSSVFQLSPSNAKNESSLLKTIKEMNEDMLRALLAANSTLHKEVSECKEEIRMLRRQIKKSGNFDSFTESSNLPTLPVRTIEEMETLEKVLKIEDEKRNLVLKLSTYGGSHVRSIINTMMNNLMSRAVATLFSLQGKASKRSFQPTSSFTCVLGEYLRC